jgi:hypothetical protein
VGFDAIDRKFRRKEPGFDDPFLRPVGERKCEPEETEEHCDTCQGVGWVDERLGGIRTSGWSECPDCHNPNRICSP